MQILIEDIHRIYQHDEPEEELRVHPGIAIAVLSVLSGGLWFGIYKLIVTLWSII